MWWLYILSLFLLYKILDYLIRIPIRKSPDGVIDNILVTGCDTGFGRLLALRLIRKGFCVFASCLGEAGKEELERAAGSGRLKAFIMDIKSTPSIEKALHFVQEHLGHGKGLWGLVNNAGIGCIKAGPHEWLIKDDYTQVCDVNIFGHTEVTRIFLPLIRKTRGRIVNVTSFGGRIGAVHITPYIVSKFCAEGYSECLRKELKPFGINVHIIEPGFHKTPIADTSLAQSVLRSTWDRLSDDMKKQYPGAIEEICKNTDDFISTLASSNLEEVVDCYEHALLGYFPRGRYVVGKDTRLLWPLTFLPEWVSDLIMSSSVKYKVTS